MKEFLCTKYSAKKQMVAVRVPLLLEGCISISVLAQLRSVPLKQCFGVAPKGISGFIISFRLV